ncbi:bromodomain protein, putative [Plasmodium relictum]|uniref:Bromodomain protein, putative n=1 Tax=Plasmodium relictum TaxID=85471 RepID=A0A1J1H3Q9_PLARL|nr:bromodomain protein, putative [Plasmodium relictum]CRG99200.1 bromodomain protein, putative [Plasmodium relictum]
MMYEDFNTLPLIKSIREDDFDQVLEFLEKNYKEYEVKDGEINKKTEILDKQTQATPLFYVTARKSDDESVEISKLLIEKYALCNPTTKDLMKQTCLFYAAREGHINLCNYLIEKGCNPNDSDNFGQTCLFYASREGKTECVRNLIKKGANPNLLDFNKQTCLFYACRDGRYDTVKCLLENGVNPSIKDSQRRTALTFAKGNGHQNIINLLKNANVLNKSINEPHSQSNNLNAVKRNSSCVYGNNYHNESNNNILNAMGDNSNISNIKNEMMDINEVTNMNLNNSTGIINSFCLSNMSSNKSNSFFSDNTIRKKYKLQYRPLEQEDPLLWLDAPLIKIKEFERKFPQLALWPKNISITNTELNNINNAFNKQWYSSANQLIQSLSKYDGGHIFEKLVDPKKQNCPDYYDVIKNPMSFSCIKSKLKKGQYKSPTEFIKDVQLIFDNCNLYNTSNSLVAITGKNIETYFNNQLIVTGFNNFVSKEKSINEILKKVEEENNKWNEEQEQKKKEMEQNEENMQLKEQN